MSTTMPVAEPAAILEAALKLTSQQRADLAQQLLDSVEVEEKHPDYDRLWAAEIQRRCSEYDRGEVRAQSIDESLAKVEAALAARRAS